MKNNDAIDEIRESCCYVLSSKRNVDIEYYILSQNIQWLDIATNFPVFNILNLLGIRYKIYDDLWISPNGSGKRLMKVKNINDNSPIKELSKSLQAYNIEFADTQYKPLLIKTPHIKKSPSHEMLKHLDTVYLKLGSNFTINSQIDCETMILDLRDNMGGRLTALKNVIGQFSPCETSICELRNRNQIFTLSSLPNQNVRFKKLLVLANSKTASCSEILIHWLKENYNTTVYGDTTMGKWVSTSIKCLNEYYIKIPNYFITFRGKFYFGGIEPDVYSSPADIDNLLKRNGFYNQSLQL